MAISRTPDVTRKNALIDSNRVIEAAFNVNGYGLDVFVVNGEIPVRFSYRTFKMNSFGNPTSIRFFDAGTPFQFALTVIADDAGNLQDDFFTIDIPRQGLYDIAYKVGSGATPSTTNTTIVVEIATDDTANSVAIKTVAAIYDALDAVYVEARDDVIVFVSWRDGSVTEPVVNSTGFTVSEFTDGSDGDLLAIRFQDYDVDTAEQVVISDEWKVFFKIKED